MHSNNNTGRLVLFTFIGLVIGGISGEVLGWLFGLLGEMTGGQWDNTVRNFFIKPWELGVGYNNPEGVAVDLYFIKFKFGLGFRFNVVSILGLLSALYIEKWSRGR